MTMVDMLRIMMSLIAQRFIMMLMVSMMLRMYSTGVLRFEHRVDDGEGAHVYECDHHDDGVMLILALQIAGED